MDPFFLCPPAEFLAPVPAQDCPVRWDQIVRLMFQRKQASAPFTTTTILLEATWTALMTAEDDTTLIGTPLMANVVIPPGEPLKEGGNDNTTINGIPKLSGLGFVPVTLQLQDASDEVITALSALTSESAIMPGFTNLQMFMVNRFGQVIYRKSGATDIQGIDVYNFAVGSTGSEGLNKPNVTPISFDLAPGWSKGTGMIRIVAFNILNKNAA